MIFLRRVAFALRFLPERLLHASRRREVLRRLERGPVVGEILFVCHGNICRSPFAAGVAKTLLGPTIRVLSAGFIGPRRPSPDAAIAAARRLGVDLGAHVSRVLARQDLATADLIVVMDARQRQLVATVPEVANRVIVLGDLDPEKIETRAIRDPVDQPDDVYDASYQRIDRCVRALVEALGYN